MIRLAMFLAMTATPLVAQNAETDGELAFNNHCRTCHSMNPGDNRLGPSLHGIIGKRAGTVKGYNFSSAFADSKVIWDEKTLDAYIKAPDSVVPGNEMKPYGGLPNPEIRAAIVSYIAGN